MRLDANYHSFITNREIFCQTCDGLIFRIENDEKNSREYSAMATASNNNKVTTTMLVNFTTTSFNNKHFTTTAPDQEDIILPAPENDLEEERYQRNFLILRVS